MATRPIMMILSSRLRAGAMAVPALLALAAFAAAPAAAAAPSPPAVAFALSPAGGGSSILLHATPGRVLHGRGARAQPVSSRDHGDPAARRYPDRQQRRRGLRNDRSSRRRPLAGPGRRADAPGGARLSPRPVHDQRPGGRGRRVALCRDRGDQRRERGDTRGPGSDQGPSGYLLSDQPRKPCR